MRAPEIEFLRRDGVALAYQVFGDGAVPILNLPEWGSSVETAWEHPGHLRLWDAFGSVGRVARFDYRGTGISDHVPLEEVGDVDASVADALAIIDHLGWDSVSILAEGTSCAIAARLAARHPHRISRLVLANCSPGGDVAVAARGEALATLVAEHWGTGAVVTRAVPRLVEDVAFARRLERVGARPAVAAQMVRVTMARDLRPDLEMIAAPTLVIHTGDMRRVSVEQSRAVADAIDGATFDATPTSSFYWGGPRTVDFLYGAEWGGGERDLVVVAFTDVVGSTEVAREIGDSRWRQTLGFLDGFVAQTALAQHGRVVKQTGDGHLLEFRRPHDAIEALRIIVSRAPTLGVELRAGVHFGEVERRVDGDLTGMTVHVAARVAALAGPREVLASRTVAETAAGSGWSFADRGSRSLRGVPGTWQVFAVT